MHQPIPQTQVCSSAPRLLPSISARSLKPPWPRPGSLPTSSKPPLPDAESSLTCPTSPLSKMLQQMPNPTAAFPQQMQQHQVQQQATPAKPPGPAASPPLSRWHPWTSPLRPPPDSSPLKPHHLPLPLLSAPPTVSSLNPFLASRFLRPFPAPSLPSLLSEVGMACDAPMAKACWEGQIFHLIRPPVTLFLLLPSGPSPTALAGSLSDRPTATCPPL